MSRSAELTLMKVIGLPNSFVRDHPKLDEKKLLGAYPVSVKNRVPFFFLDQANSFYENIPSLKKLYAIYLQKAKSTLDFISKVSEILHQTDVKFVIFKTLRPFPFVTVDIDILFLDLQSLAKACSALSSHGCSLGGYGAYSVTLYNPIYNINVDLQSEIAVSRLVYVNKNLLKKHIRIIRLNGNQIPVFDQSIDLALVIAHSFYKEQIFTLADYFTTVIQMTNMTERQHRILAEFAELASTELGVKLFLNLTDALTKLVFHENLAVLANTAEIISANDFERKIIHRVIKHFRQKLKLPYKYPPVVIATAFIKKAVKDPTMRSGLIKQSIEPLKNGSFMRDVLLQAKRQFY